MKISEIYCRKCKREVGSTQNGLCHECVPTVSFMDYWQIDDPTKAARLLIVQDLNKSIQAGDKKLIKKVKSNLVNGLLEECPKSLEDALKKGGLWNTLLQSVQKIPENPISNTA